MKTKALSILLAGMLLIALSPSTLVQAQRSFHDWSGVQAIGVDERLIVKQKNGKTVEGKMIEATDNNLTMSRSGKVVTIPRDSIQQIEHSTGKAAKAKWAGIMAAAGAGAGAGIGTRKSNSMIDDGELYILIGTVIGAGAGAVGGMAFGASRRHRELIYTAP